MVCSRSNEYDAMEKHLDLPTAICMNPLSRKRIEEYLKSVGTSMDGVRDALKNDEILWELLKTPLMLYIVTQAFKGKSVESVQGTGRLEKRRTQIFDAYNKAMFHRFGRSIDKSYTPHQTNHWLSWLAKSMNQRNQSIFYLEQLQPDWLVSPTHRRILYILDALFFWGVITLFLGLTFWMTYGLTFWLTAELAVSLLIGWQFYNGDLEKEFFSKIDVFETIAPVRKYIFLIFILFISCFIGMVTNLLVLRLVGQPSSVILGLLAGMLFFWLSVLLISKQGFSQFAENMLNAPKGGKLNIRTFPNEGIHRAAKNGISLGLAAALMTFILALPLRVLFRGVDTITPGPWMLWGITAGLLIFYIYAGISCINHYLLRSLLYCNGFAPFGYAKFLDYAANLIFLRKVGGGYFYS